MNRLPESVEPGTIYLLEERKLVGRKRTPSKTQNTSSSVSLPKVLLKKNRDSLNIFH